MPAALRGEGPLAKALNAANEPSRAWLLAALLQQAQHCRIDVGDAADGLKTVHLRMDLEPATLAALLEAKPSSQALATLIGLASI